MIKTGTVDETFYIDIIDEQEIRACFAVRHKDVGDQYVAAFAVKDHTVGLTYEEAIELRDALNTMQFHNAG